VNPFKLIRRWFDHLDDLLEKGPRWRFLLEWMILATITGFVMLLLFTRLGCFRETGPGIRISDIYTAPEG
jgi:hypothetical protein